jgi:hypothetical protein
MVQSKFNLDFWFRSYNIFCCEKQVGPAAVTSLLSHLSHVCTACSATKYILREIAVDVGIARV